MQSRKLHVVLGSEWNRDCNSSVAYVECVVLVEEATEDQGGDRRELDQNVNGGAGSVLKRVTNGVTSNGCLMALSLLLHEDLGVGGGVNVVLGEIGRAHV